MDFALREMFIFMMEVETMPTWQVKLFFQDDSIILVSDDSSINFLRCLELAA